MRLVVCFVVMVSCALGSTAARGERSIYLDGVQAESFQAYAISDPMPALGVHSSTDTGWSGRLLSSGFELTNGQINSAALPPSAATISAYNAPHGYALSAQPYFGSAGVQFTMEMETAYRYATLLTLWDDASVFDVPVDTAFIWKGGPPDFVASEVHADAGGPYVLGEGGAVAFDASNSFNTFWRDDGHGGYDTTTSGVSGDDNLPYWRLNGVDVAFGLHPSITYDALVDNLGLTPGTYELTLDLNVPVVGRDTATTTLRIVPEPPTACLGVLLTALLSRRRTA